MNPWVIVAFVLACVGNFAAGHFVGADHERARWEAKVNKERALAIAEARAQEHMWQEVVDGTVKNYEADLARIRGSLRIALDSLRDRPDRPAGVSEAPRSGCAGANGAELGKSHAGFLARFAALAAGQDAALAACYAVLDGVSQ
ncbi:MAG: hypothetical protein Q8O34_00765 [Rhodocyclaceae bacterium]|nr:hypothetical protein [Rhodocyclaceae bacterium]